MVAMNDVPAPTSRARHGRWLGGVCAGLAARWGVPVARVRIGFVLASAVVGLGVLVYIAAWLILPGEGEDAGQRGIVLLAQAIGALLGLVTLAGAGAAATVFGYGWAVVAVAGAVLIGALAGWARLGPAWALLPVGALVLPSVAFAVGGLRIEPSTQGTLVYPHILGAASWYSRPFAPWQDRTNGTEIGRYRRALPNSATRALCAPLAPR